MSKLDIVSDGSTLVTMSEFMIHVWDLPSGDLRYTRSVAYPDNRLRDFVVNEAANLIAYLASGEDNEVIFIDLTTGRKVHPAGAPGPRSWTLPDDWVPESVDVVGGSDGEVLVANAYGDIKILDPTTWRERAVTTNERLRAAYWLDSDTILFAGPGGLGMWRDGGGSYFVDLPHQRAYADGGEVMVLRFMEGGTQVMGYLPRWSTAIPQEFLTAGTELWVADPALDTAGIVRLDPDADGQHTHLHGYTSGRLELRGADGSVWGAAHAASRIAEVNDFDARTFDATATGDVIAVAREAVVSVYGPVARIRE